MREKIENIPEDEVQNAIVVDVTEGQIRLNVTDISDREEE